MRRLALSCFLVFVILVGSALSGETTYVRRLEFTTPDSLKLTCWLTPTSNQVPAPLIVCLHQYQSNHQSFDYLMDQLDQTYMKDTLHHLEPYPYILTLDLRGHGLSKQKGSKTVDYQARDESEFSLIPSDVALAIRGVLEDTTLNIDTSKIYVVGASIGANAAAILTEQIPYISKIVLLSPGENYIGLEPTEAIEKFKGKILIFVCMKDDYAYESSKKFEKIGGDKVELNVFKRGFHGTEILNYFPTSTMYMIDWLLAKKTNSN